MELKEYLLKPSIVNPRYNILGFHPSFAQVIAFCLIIAGIAGELFFKKKISDRLLIIPFKL